MISWACLLLLDETFVSILSMLAGITAHLEMTAKPPE